MFAFDEAAQISTIPLSMLGSHDTMVWHPNRSGDYTVRSGYRWLYEAEQHEQVVKEGKNQVPWKNIWKLIVPTKIKLFIWKMMRAILPVRTNLENRHIPVERLCERCNQNEESIYHALRQCPKAKACWNQLQFEWDTELFGQNENEQWLLKELKNLDQVALQHFAITTWTIWFDRNAETHGEGQKPANILARSVSKYGEDFTQAQQRWYNALSRPFQRWKPPRPCFVKINFDAALDMEAHKGGLGIVIRDEEGKIMGANQLSLFQ